jgi:hypothetical protein
VTTPTTIHPPLTRAEFDDGCGYRYRGVPFIESEDGSIFAYGHIDPALFVEVVHDFDVEMASDSEPRHELTDVQHCWATVVLPSSDPDGWQIEWGKTSTAETPGAFPVTVVAR